MKNIIGNKQKRYYRKAVFRYYRAGFVLCLIIVALIYCAVFGNTQNTSPNALETKIEVKAVEITPQPKVTPVMNPNRRYQNYSHMPKYDYIISELQMLYFNWEDAADLNSHENGFNPMAINPTSGACGLTQALPCSKLPCELGDIKCDLKFQKDYIARRYGTVTKALEFWKINNWY